MHKEGQEREDDLDDGREQSTMNNFQDDPNLEQTHFLMFAELETLFQEAFQELRLADEPQIEPKPDLETLMLQNVQPVIPDIFNQHESNHSSNFIEAELIKPSPNAMKNLITNFVKWIRNHPYPKAVYDELKQAHRFTKQFVKICERLEKKMKTDKQKHTLDQFRSLLVYKDVKDTAFTRYLLTMAEDFVNNFYSEIIDHSPRMSTSPQTFDDNLNVILNVRSLVEKELRYLLVNNQTSN